MLIGAESLCIKVSGVPDLLQVNVNERLFAKRRTCLTLQNRAVRKSFPSEWVKAGELKKGDWLAIPKRAGLPKSGLSASQLYAVGFWLAEGHLLYNMNKECVGIGLTNTNLSYIERVERTLKDWFPVRKVTRCNQFTTWETTEKPKTWLYGRQRGRNAYVYEWDFRSRVAGEFFSKFGLNALTKQIPSDLFDCSEILPIVCGYLDGDGSQRKNQQMDVSIYTSSEMLARQMRQILIDSGVWCTLARVSRKTKLKNTEWIINIKASFLHLLTDCKVRIPKRKFLRHVMEDEYYFYSPVREITFQGLVARE